MKAPGEGKRPNSGRQNGQPHSSPSKHGPETWAQAQPFRLCKIQLACKTGAHGRAGLS